MLSPGVAILTFSSLVYICETEFGVRVPINYNNQTLYILHNDTWSYVECFWWGLMTLTTVGYESNPTVRPVERANVPR